MNQNRTSPNRLHKLCCSRSPAALELVRSLLSRGANPKERGDEGLTPLHAAAAYDNVAICQLLLHFGADVCAKDDLGRTPLVVATGNAKIFLTRHIERDRRTQRGILRRFFVCQAGVLSPVTPPKQSFVKNLQNRVRRSFGFLKRPDSNVEEAVIPMPATVAPTIPRRRARTPDILEKTPRVVRTPKRSKTPDFDPGARPTPKTQKRPLTPDFYNGTQRNAGSSKPTTLVVAAKTNGNKLPPRKMVPPSAPPLTPKSTKKSEAQICIVVNSPNITPRRGRKPKVLSTSSASEYVTAEEGSLEISEMEQRLSQLKIRTNEPVHIDEKKLQYARRLKDSQLRVELRKFGIAAGPICSRTRKLYEKKLVTAMEGHSAVVSGSVKYSRQLEIAFNGKYDLQIGRKLDEAIKTEFSNTGVTAFVYILLDPRILGDETKPSLKNFVEAIFYIGKGTKARPLAHLIDAKRLKIDASPKLENSKKFSRINSIWNSGHGVGLLELSHTISDKEAFTREAAFIEAIRLENLCNIKGGEWHGITRQWDPVNRANLGVFLLEQARIILHTMSVRRVVPEDLPDTLYPFVNTRRR